MVNGEVRQDSTTADLIFPVFRGRIWLIVFGFGLFHGFGFAGALEEMGLLRENLGLALFGFNLGVELGQLAIVILVFPVLFAMRRLAAYRQLLLPAVMLFMAALAAAMLLYFKRRGWIWSGERIEPPPPPQ